MPWYSDLRTALKQLPRNAALGIHKLTAGTALAGPSFTVYQLKHSKPGVSNSIQGVLWVVLITLLVEN